MTANPCGRASRRAEPLVAVENVKSRQHLEECSSGSRAPALYRSCLIRSLLLRSLASLSGSPGGRLLRGLLVLFWWSLVDPLVVSWWPSGVVVVACKARGGGLLVVAWWSPGVVVVSCWKNTDGKKFRAVFPKRSESCGRDLLLLTAWLRPTTPTTPTPPTQSTKTTPKR